jgi:hypothetical protein
MGFGGGVAVAHVVQVEHREGGALRESLDTDDFNATPGVLTPGAS